MGPSWGKIGTNIFAQVGVYLTILIGEQDSSSYSYLLKFLGFFISDFVILDFGILGFPEFGIFGYNSGGPLRGHRMRRREAPSKF